VCARARARYYYIIDEEAIFLPELLTIRNAEFVLVQLSLKYETKESS